jgi:hypothetical protein
MLHTLTALQGAEHFLIAAARLWAAAGELLTAGAILWALDTLARAIRGAYAAGRFVGRIAWPVIYWTAAVVRLIDWRIVAAVVIDCLKVLAVAAYVAAVMARRGLIALSAAMGRRYGRRGADRPDRPGRLPSRGDDRRRIERPYMRPASRPYRVPPQDAQG